MLSSLFFKCPNISNVTPEILQRHLILHRKISLRKVCLEFPQTGATIRTHRWLASELCEAPLMYGEFVMRRLIGALNFRMSGQPDIAHCSVPFVPMSRVDHRRPVFCINGPIT